jgi:hypothetical protein
MPAFFDYFHRLNSPRGDKKQNALLRRDKRGKTGRQDQGERIERPDGCVIVVIVRLQLSRNWLFRGAEMVEMRVDRLCPVSGMNVLERR